MQVRKNNKSGFTLVEIMVVVAIIGTLALIALPNFLRSRVYAQQQICIENLSQIESAKQICSLETGKTEGDSIPDDELFGILKYMKKKPECPAGGKYLVNPVGTTATCDSGIPGHLL